jgi:hypothetical protein
MSQLPKESIEEFMSTVGCDENSAAMYLEMAGGDVGSAVGLFFSMMGDDPAPSSVASSAGLPSWHSLIWPSNDPPPQSWLSQTLQFDMGNGLALSQDGNGPCGVLA